MDFLNYTDWQDTADTLHMLLQMSGKVKLLYRAKRPEWAHIRQYLTLDGISTGIVPEAPVPFEINFDFREDQVVFRNYNGKTEKVALEDGKSVGDYYRQFMAALKQIDVPARIDVKSQEFYDPVDLDKDGKHRSYQKEAVLLWLDNMLFADRAHHIPKTGEDHRKGKRNLDFIKNLKRGTSHPAGGFDDLPVDAGDTGIGVADHRE